MLYNEKNRKMKLINKQIKKYSLQIVVLFLSSILSAQVGIKKEASTPDANSILHVKGDANQKNIIIEPGVMGKVGVATNILSHSFNVQADATIQAIRLIGADGFFGHGNKLNFGDLDQVFFKEDEDDNLTIHSFLRTAIMGNNISINTYTPETTALLNMQSTGKGLLIPRMTQAQIAAINDPASGLLVLNTDDLKFYVYRSCSSNWTELQIGSSTIAPGPFACGQDFTDPRDGKVYRTVKIGSQCWMAENLKATKYPNGDPIPLITDTTAWNNLSNNNTDDAYCYYDNDINRYNDFGALYNYAAAIADNWTRDNVANQGICPNGWHLPTETEWQTLVNNTGGLLYAGISLKEKGHAHWGGNCYFISNASGFTAYGGGFRYENGVYGNLMIRGGFVTSTENSATLYTLYYLQAGYSNHICKRAYSQSYEKSVATSVRCIKN
jgi:uncharacterized protein (TIGR02145 family)